MRVNIYAEEMTDRVGIVEKVINGQTFTGLRFYLELPVTLRDVSKTAPFHVITKQVRGPFIHSVIKEGEEGMVLDDDSSAVTFWGKADLREVLAKALMMLDVHYERRKNENKSNN